MNMRQCHFIRQFSAGLLAAGALGSFSVSARADTTCGSAPAGWNVPNGATAFSVAPGTIADVLGALGESRSHSMLSHGPDSWVTHATSTKPGYVEKCDNPVDINFMAASTPGLATIDQGGIYTFLYLNGGGPTNLWYQNAANITYPITLVANVGGHLQQVPGTETLQTGPLIGNTFLGTDEWGDQQSWDQMTVGSDTVWGIQFAFNDGTTLAAPAQIYYGWSQYMNIGNTAQGYPTAQPQGKGYGVVCSTSLAMWQHDALYNKAGYTGDVLPRTYPPPTVTSAANALFSDIYNTCSGATNIADGGSFGASVWSGIACLGISVCSNAANQIVNAFAADGFFDDVMADWQNIVNNNSAVSISPDDVACWNSNGTGAPCAGSGSSVWGWDSNNTVQWNSGGSAYGCW
jgi:hypothetical protein